jgi:hypothetical protein
VCANSNWLFDDGRLAGHQLGNCRPCLEGLASLWHVLSRDKDRLGLDWSEKIAGLVPLALIALQPRHAGSQDFACCDRAIARARSKHASALAERRSTLHPKLQRRRLRSRRSSTVLES